MMAYPEFHGVHLDSISLFFDEAPCLEGVPLKALLNLNFSKYQLQEACSDEKNFSPGIWSLPQVFHKKLTAYSEYYFNEVNKQNILADTLRYNFSNGMQISAKEILRHPLHEKVAPELLPQETAASQWSSSWELLQQRENFFNPTLQVIEKIIQVLLENATTRLRQGKLHLYLQTRSHPLMALKINSIEFDPVTEMNWRVDFTEKAELHTEFKLMDLRKHPHPGHLHFYQSFSLRPEEGLLLVHPWFQEFSQLQEVLTRVQENLHLENRGQPGFEVSGELEAKTILKYLRSRMIPLKLSGEATTLEPQQSRTEIHLDSESNFSLQHEARLLGRKNIVRKGWTAKSNLYLQTLSRGMAFLLNAEAKDIASRNSAKREWDLKLLKHLGILQYIAMETLSVHFEGTLSDGTEVEKDELFQALHQNIAKLLLAGSKSVFTRDLSLHELCSRSVLSCFKNFVELTLRSLTSEENFYTEQGEVILQGIVAREFRLIYELLKEMALSSGGESFKKSRTPFLAKVCGIKFPESLKDSATAPFHFPSGEDKKSLLSRTLESLQALVPHNFKIYFKGQSIQELKEDEFHVDFMLQSMGEGGAELFNWFELNPKFFLHGEEVDPAQLLSLGSGGVLEYQGKLFLIPSKQVPSLRRLEHFWLKLQKGKMETQKKKREEAVYQLPRSQTLELLALRASGVEIRGDEEWQKLCDFYDKLGTLNHGRTHLAPAKSILKPYQVTGVQWLQDLYSLRLGALLADEMGLGKTLQTLSFLEGLYEKKEMGQVLIVMPSSLIFNWQSEIEKFTPELPVSVFSNREKDAIGKRLEAKEEMLVLITYGLLLEHGEFINQYRWKVLIFDEAQNLKNLTAKRTSVARSITAQFRICLTGTPMENHYGEFYSLVDLLVPGSLGKVESFRQQFVNTEMVSQEEMEDLKLKVKPLLLRRTKKEILSQLPEKQESMVSIAFEDQQKEIYRDIALSYNQKVQETIQENAGRAEAASVQLQMLTALLRLRQACSDPAGLPQVRYEKVPPKLSTLLDSVRAIIESGESVLVFTQFLQTLEHTEKLLKLAEIPVFTLHGGVPTPQRQKILSEFDKRVGGAVLAMTLKTGGVGLNLTKASYVFHLEPWWNPSVEEQATARAHRMGQSKPVQIFRYIMHESLEEKIESLKVRKDRKFQALFSNTEKETELGDGWSALSKQDFDLLLGIK